MRQLISVIVPVYNVEDCLARCLDSLCRQSFADIEIILIDDASPDKCGSICDSYAAKDARFRVFHNKTNCGLSMARNMGIKHAKCEYLMFVDSDDYVHDDFCKEAYECMIHNQADLVIFRFHGNKKSENVKKIHNTKNNISSGLKTRLETMDLLEKSLGQHAWNNLYRKELFNNISYPPGYLYEDVGTTYKIVWKAKRIYYLDKILYYHCYHNGSITTLKTKKSLQDWMEMWLQQYRDLVSWGYPHDKLVALRNRIAIDYCIRKKADPSDNYYKKCKGVLLANRGIPVNFTRKHKILFVLFKYCRPLFEMVCILFNKKMC